MYLFLLALILFLAFLLILVILVQNPKGGGLSSEFSMHGTAQIMGLKKTGDFLMTLTWGFAISIMVLSLFASSFVGGGPQGETSPNIDRAVERRIPGENSFRGNDEDEADPAILQDAPESSVPDLLPEDADSN